MDVLRHRVIVTYEAEAENKTSEDIIRMILDTSPCRNQVKAAARGLLEA